MLKNVRLILAKPKSEMVATPTKNRLLLNALKNIFDAIRFVSAGTIRISFESVSNGAINPARLAEIEYKPYEAGEYSFVIQILKPNATIWEPSKPRTNGSKFLNFQ
jgi:hypothetical protein